MCATLLACPLCSLPRFSDLESLRIGLIKVATENLVCPVCNDILMGLDKLTIHLFSHCESDLFKFKPDKNMENEDSRSIEKLEPLDPTHDTDSSPEETQSTNTLGETFASSRRKTKNKICVLSTLADNSELSKTTNFKSDQRVTVFNINTIPFIGIPENISNLQKCKKNLKSPSEKSKNGKSDKLSEKCDICGFYFLGKNILEMHKKLIHNVQNSEIVNGVSKYCCHLCSKVFKMRGSLMVHLRMVHFGIIPSVKQDDDSSQVFTNTPRNMCDNLGCETTTLNTVDINYDSSAKHDIETLTRNNKSPQVNDIYNNVNGNNSSIGTKQWTCDICNKQFTTKYFLKKHKRLHTGEMPYSCSQCNKTFTFQQSYHKHLLYHNDDKPHQCSHCGRAFKELSTLHNHQRIHTGEKPFSCETCGKCFRQRVSYLVHRRIHTGVMPYKCTACEKSFRYKVSQRTHKCTAQPPGTIVRQSGDLVQKLIKNQQESENNEIDASSCTDEVDHETLNGEMKFSHNFNFGSRRNSESSAGTSRQSQNDNQFMENLCQNVGHSLSDTLNCDEHLHSKNERQADEKNIIDELVSESILKMDFSHPIPSTSRDYDSMVTDLYSMISPQRDAEDNLPSPSENFKNLKLSPPAESILEGISQSMYTGAESPPVYQLSPSNTNDRFVKNINDEEFVFNNSQYRNSVFQRR